MSALVDGYELPRFATLPDAERYDELVAVVERADEEGVLNRLPIRADEVMSEEAVASRILTIRTRLFLLGYLGRDNGKARIGRRMRKAIAAFQSDSGLKPDQWVGEKTWNALQELVAFENPPDLDRWFLGDEPRPVLRRALEARLYVLGLMDSRHPETPEKVTRALADFLLVSEFLGHVPPGLEATLSRATVAALFDQNGIAKCLARAEDVFSFDGPLPFSAQRARGLARKFYVANLRIELWLRGYRVRLGGSSAFDAPAAEAAYEPEDFRVYHAVWSFWRDAGKTSNGAAEAARAAAAGNDVALFRKLLAIDETGSEVGDQVAAARLYERVAEAPVDLRRSAWEQVKALGSRIWDGVKRTWRWLKSMVVRNVKKAIAWARNVARLAFSYASEAFGDLKRAVVRAVEAVKFIAEKVVPDSDRRHLQITRDADCDYRVFLNANHDPAKVDGLIAEFTLQTRRFRVAVRTLGALLEILIDAIRKTALGGWFGFVMALVKLRSQRDMVREFLELGREQNAAA